MKKRNLLVSRKMVAGVAAAMMLFVGAASAKAGSTDLTANGGPADQINQFVAQAGTAGDSSPTITPKTAPVTKLSVIGRVNESLGVGGCLNNPFTSTCTGANCDFVTMSGQMAGFGLGKSNLDACLTINLDSASGDCYTGLGIGTLTAPNGHLINLSFAGDLCLADENLSTVTIYYTSNLSYLVEGGTGPFATETGDGNLTVSDIFVNPGTAPYPGTGEITMTGNLARN
jgi:hypothetical protein